MLCIILGAGGQARETFWHARQARGVSYEKFVFVDDFTDCTFLEIAGQQWPVEKNWSFSTYTTLHTPAGFVVGVGSPQLKTRLVTKALASGLTPLPAIIHQRAIIQDPNCRLGAGSVIAAGCVLTTNITLGSFVSLNSNVTIGHDTKIGDFCTIAPQAAIAGNVVLDHSVVIGIGAVVKEKVSIASSTIVGAQACVVKDITEVGKTVIGVPALPLAKESAK